MKRYFEEKFVPELCYPTEAAHWRALGRLPFQIYYDGGVDDSRDKLNDGEPVTSWEYGYTQEELDAHGIAVDYPRYDKARSIIPALHEMQLAAEPNDAAVAFHQKHLAEFAWWAEINRKMDSILEAHKAVVFGALSTGQLRASGYRISKELETNSMSADWPDLFREDIPRDAWTMKGYDWDACKLSLHDGSVFRCVTIEWDQVIELWPLPDCAGQQQVGTLYAGLTMVIDDDLAPTSLQHVQPRRGAPPKGDNLSVRSVVINWFGDRAAQVAEGEKEALIAEVMAFAQKACGHAVGRSTVGDWLRPLYPKAPTVMPGNRAGNYAGNHAGK